MKGISVVFVLLLCVCMTAAAEPAGEIEKQLQGQEQEIALLEAQVAQLKTGLTASKALLQNKGTREQKLDKIVAELSSKDKSDLDPPLLGNFEGLTLDGEIRLRSEWWNELDFNTSTASDNAFTLLRARLGFEVKVDDQVSAYIQLQDSRVFGTEPSTEAHIGNVDLHQVYVDWQTPYVEWMVRAGRQELSYGSERIIGKDDWHNVGRAFDGVKVTCSPSDDLTIDGFAVKVRELLPWPVVPGHFDQDLYGVYGSYTGLADKTIDGYVLLLNDTASFWYPGSDPARFVTVGGRLAGKLDALDYEAELAVQNGDWGTDNLDGWAFRLDLGYVLEDMMWSPKLGAEYNWASGDHNPTDGHDDTFRPLFPSSHLYGQMDLVGWQNTSNVGLNVSCEPVEKWSAKLSYWLFYREDEEDLAYDSWGVPTVPVAVTNTDEQLAWEVDLNVKYQCSDAFSMEGGYSRFVPGNSITDTGVDDGADFVYFQTALSF